MLSLVHHRKCASRIQAVSGPVKPRKVASKEISMPSIIASRRIGSRRCQPAAVSPQLVAWAARQVRGLVPKILIVAARVKAQALFCRRRHQPRRPPLARIRPGKPAGVPAPPGLPLRSATVRSTSTAPHPHLRATIQSPAATLPCHPIHCLKPPSPNK